MKQKIQTVKLAASQQYFFIMVVFTFIAFIVVDKDTATSILAIMCAVFFGVLSIFMERWGE